MRSYLKALLFLLMALAVISLYTFLHEAGHALASLAQGGRMTAFSINFFDLSAHVSLIDNLSAPGRALMNICGMALPVTVWFLWMAIARRRDNPVVELTKLVSTLSVLNTLLVWIAIPFFYLADSAPAGDDVTHFLDNSGVPPLALAAAATLVYAAGWMLFARRSIGLKAAIRLLRDPAPWDFNIVRQPLAWGCAILALVWGSTLALNLTLPGETARQATPSEDYHQIARIDLKEGNFQDRLVTGFSLSQTGGPGIFIEVDGIDTPYIDIRLLGPGGYEQVVLHGEGYAAWKDTPWLPPNPALPPGDYRLVLNSRQSPGSVTVFLQELP